MEGKMCIRDSAKEAQEVPEAKVVQEAPAYTPDMPVEDILEVTTLEQAQEIHPIPF